mgnify:CR=1 FL=1
MYPTAQEMAEPAEPTAEELLKEVRYLELKMRRLVNAALVGDYRSVLRGTGLEIDQLRQFQFGDEVRSIDWNVSARTGSLYVKQYQEERERQLLVVLDRSGSMNFEREGLGKYRRALELLALLGLSAFHSNDRFGLLTHTGAEVRYLPPATGRSHLLRCLQAAIRPPAISAANTLETLLQVIPQRQKQPVAVVVLSDFLLPHLEANLRSLTGQHEWLLWRLYHPAEHSAAGIGLQRFRLLESGREGFQFGGLKWPWQRRRNKLLSDPYPALHHQLHRWSKRTGGGYLPLNLYHDSLAAVQRFFVLRSKQKPVLR